MPEKSKRPNRVVSADDFVVDVDGEPCYPHAGESVTFIGRLTTNDLMRCMKMQQIDLDAPNADEQIADIHKFLAGRITKWDWTDDDGNLYPSPPTPEVIGQLDMDELGWLLMNNMAPRKKETEQEQGEASTPST